MRKILKLSITLVLAIAMLFAVAIIASAETEPTDSGECGSGSSPSSVIWEYYADTKTLVISGSGSVKSYEGLTETPWANYRTEIENLVIEPGIINIGRWAFAAMNKVETITLPDTVAFIGASAFYNCKALKTLNLGRGVTDIVLDSFGRGLGVAPIEVVNVPSLKDWFEIKFHYPASNPAANSNLYVDGKLLEDVVIPSDVTDVPQYAFFKVKSIKNVTFHENVETIGPWCFAAASNVETITFDGCSPAIDTNAFYNLKRGTLTDIYINDAKAWFNSSFKNLESDPMFIGKVNVHINGVVLDNDSTRKVDFVIPDGVTTIPGYAIYSRYSMSSLTIPASVTEVDAAGLMYLNYCKTIYGEAGSYAQTYARIKNLNFVAISPADVTAVTVDKDDSVVNLGETLQATATISPAEGTLASVVWSSSDITVATVSNGLVKAVGAGTATITATASDGSFSDSFDVTVPKIPVASVTLSADEAELRIGHRIDINYTVAPANATAYTAEWFSNNRNVAVVSDGIVTAKAAGTATISLFIDGVKKAACTVTVIDPNAPADIKVTGVTLDTTAATLEPAETLQLTATVVPADATNANVTWKSSNDAVATVVNGLVTAVADGNATITVTTVDGEFTATCAIVVETPAPEYVPVEGISLEVDELELVIGDTYKFTISYTPDNTTEVDVVWFSDAEDIVTFNEEGELITVGVGTTWVWVEAADNPDIYAECQVTVVAGRPVQTIALNKTTANLTVSDKLTLEVTFTPANATNKNIIWTTDNATVATVENGVVTAVGSGVANITATSEENPELSVTCKIIVEGTNETPALPW